MGRGKAIALLDLDKITERFTSFSGKLNHRWVNALPEQLEKLAREWDIEIGDDLGAEFGADFASGVYSVVVSCTGPHGDAVVKLAADAYGLNEEVAMLRQFAPSGRVPEVYETTRGAVLMEAILPGTPVELLPEHPSPAEYGEFLNKLHAAGDPASAPRKVNDWLQLMYGWSERKGTDVAESRRISEELLASPADEVLLHGDLHLGNVLACNKKGLVARSPIACVGERCLDAADYVLEGPDRENMVWRRDELAREAGLDLERLDAWCRAMAPLGASRSPHPKRVSELLAFGRGEY
jgi:streptomycin 6-kinase